MISKRKIAVAISGASGSIYAALLLEELKKNKDLEVALVLSKNAGTVWQEELKNEDYKHLPFKVYDNQDYYAPFASGSSTFDTLIIVPCSMGTIGRIASGISDNLISRAADVMLKERKKLICVVRETPYNLIHLRQMTSLTEAGAIICPASPSFYSKPENIAELALTVVHRIMKLAGIPYQGFAWGSTQ